MINIESTHLDGLGHSLVKISHFKEAMSLLGWVQKPKPKKNKNNLFCNRVPENPSKSLYCLVKLVFNLVVTV
jgi:hypothetical protein